MQKKHVHTNAVRRVGVRCYGKTGSHLCPPGFFYLHQTAGLVNRRNVRRTEPGVRGADSRGLQGWVRRFRVREIPRSASGREIRVEKS